MHSPGPWKTRHGVAIDDAKGRWIASVATGTPPRISEEAFESMVRKHDLTFAFSDDHRVWERGTRTLDEIHAAKALLPREVAVRIWNKVVDEKIVHDSRDLFYWSL